MGRKAIGSKPITSRCGSPLEPTNRNIIEGGQSGMSVHNFTKSRHSALDVNGAVGQRRFQCLPTEILFTCVYDVKALMRATSRVMNKKSAEAIVVSQKLGAERRPFKLRDQNSLDS